MSTLRINPDTETSLEWEGETAESRPNHRGLGARVVVDAAGHVDIAVANVVGRVWVEPVDDEAQRVLEAFARDVARRLAAMG